MSESLIDRVIEQMLIDIEGGDLSAIEELLKSCTFESLEAYLPEGNTNA